MKVSLEQIVRNVKELPPLPQVVEQVIKITNDPESTARELNDVICKDQVLTAKVLRLANSAYYGFARRITTIVEAIVILGFKSIHNMVIAASVHDLLSKEVPGYQLGKGELWRHSIACAMTARLLARQARFSEPDQAYVAALLHDIGKIILSVYVQETYFQIIEKVQKDQIPFSQAEQEILGFTHADIGARMAERWNFPPKLVEAIALHHRPESALINPQLTSIVHIADAVCLMMGIGIGSDGLCYSLSPKAFELLGLKPGIVENLIEKLKDVFIDEIHF